MLKQPVLKNDNSRHHLIALIALFVLMKLLATTVIMCILFLSSFGGVISMRNSAAKMPCGKSACMKACKHDKKPTANDNCNGTSCPMMFSCSICGFMPVTPVGLKTFFHHIEKPVTPYKIGNLSEYHPTGWQPPEVYA
jgi:hypothetical protein